MNKNLTFALAPAVLIGFAMLATTAMTRDGELQAPEIHKDAFAHASSGLELEDVRGSTAPNYGLSGDEGSTASDYGLSGDDENSVSGTEFPGSEEAALKGSPFELGGIAGRIQSGAEALKGKSGALSDAGKIAIDSMNSAVSSGISQAAADGELGFDDLQDIAASARRALPGAIDGAADALGVSEGGIAGLKRKASLEALKAARDGQSALKDAAAGLNRSVTPALQAATSDGKLDMQDVQGFLEALKDGSSEASKGVMKRFTQDGEGN